jgi:hypothetical protein
MKYLLPSLLILLLTLSSCANYRQLQAHRSELQRLAQSNLDPQEKFDGLAEVLATVLEESTDLSSPVKSYRYVQKFTNQNQRALDQLSSELLAWQADMNGPQKLAFTTRALSQGYSRRLIRVIPKLERTISENDYKLSGLEKTLLLFKLKRVFKR